MTARTPVVQNGSNFEVLQPNDTLDPQSLPISPNKDNAISINTDGLYVENNFSSLGGMGVSMGSFLMSDANKDSPNVSERNTVHTMLPVSFFNYINRDYIRKYGTVDSLSNPHHHRILCYTSGEISLCVENNIDITGADISLSIATTYSGPIGSILLPSRYTIGPYKVTEPISNNGKFVLTDFYNNYDDRQDPLLPAERLVRLLTIPVNFTYFLSESFSTNYIIRADVTINHNGANPFRFRLVSDTETFIRSGKNV